MPIPKETQLTTIQGMLAASISAYNSPGTYTERYNHDYNRYIVGRAAGISAAGSLAAWLASGEAASSIRALLKSFGMNARNSELVPLHAFQGTLAAINPENINWVSGISLPLDIPPQVLMNPAAEATLSSELAGIYKALATPGSITISGGYVAASKAIHCLLPELAPMIDGQHGGFPTTTLTGQHILRRCALVAGRGGSVFQLMEYQTLAHVVREETHGGGNSLSLRWA
jgi:hypothetical protein